MDLIEEMERQSKGPAQQALAAEARNNPAMVKEIHRRWCGLRRRAERQSRLRAATNPPETA
jgi:hypothetical protein